MRKLYTFIVALLFCQCMFAQSILSIKVIDNEKLNMPGATIKLMPGNIINITNQSGVATFQQIKPGSYAINISYIG